DSSVAVRLATPHRENAVILGRTLLRKAASPATWAGRGDRQLRLPPPTRFLDHGQFSAILPKTDRDYERPVWREAFRYRRMPSAPSVAISWRCGENCSSSRSTPASE